VQFKLKKVKNFLKGWGFNKIGSNKKKGKDIEDEMMNLELLEESGSLSESQIKMRNALKIELMNILEEEETYWFKRSHGNWLLKGEQHRIFFS
jgi:hypothetical protein